MTSGSADTESTGVVGSASLTTSGGVTSVGKPSNSSSSQYSNDDGVVEGLLGRSESDGMDESSEGLGGP